MPLNTAILMGRLTADPELKQTTSGLSVTNFSIAVDRKYQPQGQQKQTDFIDIVAWRNTADFVCRYFSKGSMIAIVGEIQTRTYQDQNGNNRKVTEIVASDVSFCGSKAESGSQGSAEAPRTSNTNTGATYMPSAYSGSNNTNFDPIPDDDGLPF